MTDPHNNIQNNFEQQQPNQIIEKLLSRLKRKHAFYFSVTSLLVGTCLLLLITPLDITLWLRVFLFVSFFIVALIYFINSKKYRAITASNLLEDINRQFSRYQESAQLLALINPSKNHKFGEQNTPSSYIQSLQKKKIEKLFIMDFHQGQLFTIGAKTSYTTPIILFFISLFIFVAGDKLTEFIELHTAQLIEKSLPDKIDKPAQVEKGVPFLTETDITVTPPEYTKIAPTRSSSLDLEVPEGSQILWSLEFSDPDINYYYQRSGLTKVALSKALKRRQITDQINQTSLYRLSYQRPKHQAELEGVYSIAVIRDQAPKVKIIYPAENLLEITKQGNPEFILETTVSDDYGIADVSILASVAKGSGEAVKFRDKHFKFESSERTKNNSLTNSYSYRKTWSLIKLGMEPGDEVYFNILATDNKLPKPQTTKSSSVIVRWLEEQDIEIAAEGIKIGFVPEYFRSQRQIIIETEQLIADRKDLERNLFEQVSTDLGHSQSDLKQKYGQYLGDEFGEGPGEHFGLADGYHGGETHDAGEATNGNLTDQLESDHTSEPAAHQHEGEQHGNEELTGAEQTDLSGASQLIQQFAHNHGGTEIGPLSNRDPKSWMKMAVNEMWQAELHLMLSEPKLALPFEYKAYSYLKKAQQAERIYAKRLGFEPPPVTEDRRLSGELQAILKNDLSFVDQLDPDTDKKLFEMAYRILKNKSAALTRELLSEKQSVLFSNLSKRLLVLSENRSILVKYATISERIASIQSLNLKRCDQCILQLEHKLWQLLPASISLPQAGHQTHGLSPELEKKHLQALQALDINSGTKND